jgi:hypothetical protein
MIELVLAVAGTLLLIAAGKQRRPAARPVIYVPVPVRTKKR